MGITRRPKEIETPDQEWTPRMKGEKKKWGKNAIGKITGRRSGSCRTAEKEERLAAIKGREN